MSDLSPFATDESFPARSLAFSPRGQALFLDALANCGNARLACEAAAISPQTAYRARRAKPAFARLWDAALIHARAAVEQVLADRALNGVDEPIYYRGEEIGHRRRYDSRLLLAHLARLDRLTDAAAAGTQTGESVGVFDSALAVLEGGEEWAPAGGSADHADEAVPELEAEMRLLEAQGWVDVAGEWVFRGADGPADPDDGKAGDAESPSNPALARRATSAFALRENGEDEAESSAFLPEAQMGRWRAPEARDGGAAEEALPPDPHDFHRWEKGRKGGQN